MKVILLARDFPPMPGGIAVFVQHICQELIRNGAGLEVIGQEDQDIKRMKTFDAAQPYPIYRFPKPRRFSSLFPILGTVFHALKSRSNIIFLGHMESTSGLGAWFLWKVFRMSYVVLLHGFDMIVYQRNSWLDKITSDFVLENATYIFANSEYTKNLILERVKNSRDKIRVINPGVDTNIFKPGLDVSSLKKQYQIGDDQVVLTVSRLVPKKNHALVLRALPEVLGKVPKLKYMIVGEGTERARLEKIACDLGIQERVIFTGFVGHATLPSYYCLCDLFIMPSCVADDDNFESFGIVFAEASACGKPVIGSKTGGISDVVLDGNTGILVDPNNVSEISQAIVRLLTDEQLALTLGKNGRRWVENRLTWQAMGKRVMTSLQELTR